MQGVRGSSPLRSTKLFPSNDLLGNFFLGGNFERYNFGFFEISKSKKKAENLLMDNRLTDTTRILFGDLFNEPDD